MNNLDRFNQNIKRIVERKKIQRSVSSSSPETLFTKSRKSLKSVGSSVLHCADFQAWAWYADHKPHLARTFLCRRPKLCPLCAKLKSVERAYNVSDLVKTTCASSGYLYNFTLTVKDDISLPVSLDRLDNFRGLMKNHIENIKHGKYLSYTELSKILGYFLKLEIKRGSGSGSWHPHYHGMIYTLQKIDYEKFRNELNSLDGENHSNKITLMKRDDEEKFMLGILESVKYMCKFSANENFMSDLWEIYQVTYRKRMFYKYGIFRDLDEEKEVDLTPDRQVLFYHLVRFLDGDDIPESKVMSVNEFERKYPEQFKPCDLAAVPF